MAMLQAPHVVALTDFVARLRAARPAALVPDFDPTEAGVRARILLLLEAPGPKATRDRGGSGFVSPDNDDATAQSLWELFGEAGINRGIDIVTWNVVPWYIGSATRIRAASPTDLLEGQARLKELLGLLPDVRTVVLLGKKAQAAWRRLGVIRPVIECPHPSPQNLRTRPTARPAILEALKQALAAANGTALAPITL